MASSSQPTALGAFTSVVSPPSPTQPCSNGLQGSRTHLVQFCSCGLERRGKELTSSRLSCFRHSQMSSCFSESCTLQGMLSCLTLSCSHSTPDGSRRDTACDLPSLPPLPSTFSLSNRYGLISTIRGAMQMPKGTAGNSGSHTQHKTKISHCCFIPPA